MLTDRITGTKREVDVVVQQRTGDITTTWSYECRNRGRKSDVEFVDSMIGKHGRLPTNVLVLVSSSGFSTEARRVADGSGVHLRTYTQIESGKASHLFPVGKFVWSKQATWKPTKIVMTVLQPNGFSTERIRVDRDHEILDQLGRSIGDSNQFVQAFLNNADVGKQLLRDALPEHQFFQCTWDTPMCGFGSPCLRKIDSGRLCPILSIEISGSCQIGSTQVEMKHGRLEETQVAWAKTEIDGKQGMIVATRSVQGENKVDMHFQ
ncbi:MAG: hypothetical protein JNM99_23025 [Verrucomicrobiaceae bacterium]|nr:hypothetical protein [Verrucomicrobiaceae bacterium]